MEGTEFELKIALKMVFKVIWKGYIADATRVKKSNKFQMFWDVIEL